MRPYIQSGDTVLVEKVAPHDLDPGDIVLYWTPGATPDEDKLICHRLVANSGKVYTKGDAVSRIHTFENNRQAEILGRVSAISRRDAAWRRPGQMTNLAWLVASLILTPLLRMRGL
jgi:hypothetical protein